MKKGNITQTGRVCVLRTQSCRFKSDYFQKRTDLVSLSWTRTNIRLVNSQTL